MICAVKPYEGSEPYIFFSYCHEDESAVYPIIEQMGADGYRIWYDDGIHPGDDWPEVIARHIAGCAVCVAAVTARSVESHNCRNEITFVINENKPFVPIVMEQFPMSLGIKMQLGSGQYIVKYNIPSESDFFTKLYQSNALEPCWGRQSQIDLHRMEIDPIPEPSAASPTGPSTATPADFEVRPAAEPHPETATQPPAAEPRPEPVTQPPTAEPRPETATQPPAAEPRPEEAPTPKRGSDETGKGTDGSGKGQPLPSPGPAPDPMENDAPTPKRGRPVQAVLVRAADGACFSWTGEACSVGRSRSCTVFLDDRYAEPKHAEISRKGSVFSVLAHASVNGTALNGNELPAETATPLPSPAMLTIAGEAYVFLGDKDAERAAATGMSAFLECEETGERKALGSELLELGQNHVWPNGTMSDKRVSHEHGRIVPMSKGGYGYEAHKERRTNGTYYNRLSAPLHVKSHGVSLPAWAP